MILDSSSPLVLIYSSHMNHCKWRGHTHTYKQISKECTACKWLENYPYLLEQCVLGVLEPWACWRASLPLSTTNTQTVHQFKASFKNRGVNLRNLVHVLLKSSEIKWNQMKSNDLKNSFNILIRTERNESREFTSSKFQFSCVGQYIRNVFNALEICYFKINISNLRIKLFPCSKKSFGNQFNFRRLKVFSFSYR